MLSFLKRKKKPKKKDDQPVTDEEINTLLDPSKLAASLNLKSSTIKFNYFFDDSDIFRAITKGDREFFYLSRMQKKKILEYRYMSGTCFHLAVKYFQKDICHILVNLYGFDPRQPCCNGCAPIHWLMATNYEKINKKDGERLKFKSTMDFLIVRRVDLNAKDKDGCTPLHYAAKNNNDLAVERLLKEWSVRIDEMDNLKQTPMHIACKYSSHRVFKLLIESEKVKLEHLTNSTYDHLPLHSACRAIVERCDIVESLLQRIIELKLNKMLRVHLNLNLRIKLVKRLLPMVINRFDLSTQAIDEQFNQKEFILNKFEFIKVLDETSYFLKEIVNRKDSCNNRPLQLAVEQDYLNLVNLLFRYGALSMLFSSNRNLPIHIAAKVGSVEMFNLLEHHNSISFKSNSNMENLFHIAAFHNNIEFLKISCEYYLKKYDTMKNFKEFKYALEAVNNNYLTPLFLAASKSNTECVRILIEMKPMSKYYLDDYNRNLFHICFLYNSYHTLKYLIDHIDNKMLLHQHNLERNQKLSSSNPALSESNKDENENVGGMNRRTKSFLIEKLDDHANLDELKEEEVVDRENQDYDEDPDKIKRIRLADLDSAINNSRNLTDFNIMFMAESNENLTEYELFKNMLYQLDSNYNTILHMGAYKKSIRTLNLMFYLIIDNRVSFEKLYKKKNINGETFFQLACNHGCMEVVELVLKNKHSLMHNYDPINDSDNNLNSPLLSAIIHNQYRVVCLLLEHGANINGENHNKQNPLHLSCSIGSYEITEVLIRYGCSLNCFDINNMNPLSYACQNGNVEVVKLLLSLDESYLLMNYNCLDLAIEYNHPYIVEILFSNKNWEKCINYKDNKELNKLIQNLIEKMPDKMETLLDKCYDNKANKYNFKLIDQKITKNIEDHPLYLLIESDDERLITHHTTRKLLELKARTFPRIAFLLDLCLYILFTGLCTLYHLISTKEAYIFDDLVQNYTNITETIYEIKQFEVEVHPILVFLIYLSLITVVLIHLSKETFQMISYNLLNYFSSVDNWFQLTALIITIISLVPRLDPKLKTAIGSFSILFAWICMSLFFQDMELFSLGRYIVAFRKTIQNSFKFMPFFAMICLGFFFSFKVGERLNAELNKDLNVTQTSSNFIRILTMMVGELDIGSFSDSYENFSDYFKLENMYNASIFIFFVFMMCIIVLSLFEGIAVGEVKDVLDKAHIEIISSNIVYVLKIQKLTYNLYRFFNKGKEPTFMNITEHKLNKNINMTIIKQKKKNMDAVMRIENSLITLTFNFNTLTRQIAEQTQQIRSVRKRLD